MASRLKEIGKYVTRTCGCHWSRAYSSSVRAVLKSDKPHIVRQVSCYNETQLKVYKWMHCEEFAQKKKLMYEVIPGRLIRPSDIATGPKLMLEYLGIKALRQGLSLAALNIMNGRNVSHLFTRENVLFSEDGDMLFRHTCLPGEEEPEGAEHNHLAFKAWCSLYFGESSGLLAISTNRALDDSDLSLELKHLRGLMNDSASVDKRLITNHPAQMYPEELDQLILLVNHFLRNEAASAPSGDLRRSLAAKIFVALGALFPHGLYGIHPLIDYWINHGKNLGHLIGIVDGSVPSSTLPPLSSEYDDGKTLVAVLRASVLHPFGPFSARFKIEKAHTWKELQDEQLKQYLNAIVPTSGKYTMKEVQQLTHYKLPMFGPTAHSHFLANKLDDKIEVNNSTKPLHMKWTDVYTLTPPKALLLPSPRILTPRI